VTCLRQVREPLVDLLRVGEVVGGHDPQPLRQLVDGLAPVQRRQQAVAVVAGRGREQRASGGDRPGGVAGRDLDQLALLVAGQPGGGPPRPRAGRRTPRGRLKAHRLAAKLTQHALTRRAGLRRGAVARLERDNNPPDWPTLTRLVAVLRLRGFGRGRSPSTWRLAHGRGRPWQAWLW
jgi:DNA-binding XRE family transcriptional regulator